MLRSIALVFLLALCLPAADKIRVQITTGGHPYNISFYGVFTGQDGLAVTIDPHPSAFRRDLRKTVDVLVLYDLNDVTAEEQRKNLQDYLEAGGGLVVLHHALADNWQWKWWYEEVVGGRFLMGTDGEMPRSTAKAPVVLQVTPVSKHPVLDGVGPMTLNDEAYKGMWLSPRAKVLLETDNPENDKAAAWIGPWRKSRVAVIQPGHGPDTHQDAGYRRLVRNAILWASRRKD
jgi:type 1 glutamine amidotransferase